MSSHYRDSGNADCKVYVGDLDSAALKQDLEDAFSHYGPIRTVWVARNPPGFAFVEFEDARDAEDAVRGLNGRTVCGRRVKVKMSNGARSKGGLRGPPPRRIQRLRPFNPEDRCYECGERGHYARDCTQYKRSSQRRSLSRSRSRSRSRDRRTRSRSPSRSRSSTPMDRSKSWSRSRSRAN